MPVFLCLLSWSKSNFPIIQKSCYYITTAYKLELFDMCSKKNENISENVSEVFYTSGANFETTDGVTYRINLLITPSGERKKRDIHGKNVNDIFTKW